MKAPEKTAMDTAMALIFDVWRAGYWLSVERGFISLLPSPAWVGSRPDPEDFGQGISAASDSLREILSANKKDWAEKRDEFSLAPIVRDGIVKDVGLVLLEKRRTIGPAVLLQSPAALPVRLRSCNGIILPQGIKDKEPIALWLFDAGMLRQGVWIIEVPETPGEDYRDVISGSHWLKHPVRPAVDDGIGRALLTAMQARSFRKEAIRASRVDWWQALAAAGYARRHHLSAEEACRKLSLPWDHLGEWIKKALAWKPRVNREQAMESRMAGLPVTPQQRHAATGLIRDFPDLEVLFPANWDQDRAEASRHIGRALGAADRIRAAHDAYRAEIKRAIETALLN